MQTKTSPWFLFRGLLAYVLSESDLLRGWSLRHEQYILVVLCIKRLASEQFHDNILGSTSGHATQPSRRYTANNRGGKGSSGPPAPAVLTGAFLFTRLLIIRPVVIIFTGREFCQIDPKHTFPFARFSAQRGDPSMLRPIRSIRITGSCKFYRRILRWVILIWQCA